eukprot:NODE_146_length_17563_cov_0.253321.p7 type:complete len:272 gc:universal NODE_146_length_17563_cov_0.253321:10370-11185(+)
MANIAEEVEDVWVFICQYLEVEDKMKLRLNRFLDRVIKSPTLWMVLNLENSKISNTLIFQNSIRSLKFIEIKDCKLLNGSDIIGMINHQKLLKFLHLHLFYGLNDCGSPDLNLNLNTLKLINCGLNDNGVQNWIDCFPSLKELDLSNNLQLEGNFEISHTNLSLLNLSCSNIGSPFILKLPNSISILILSQCYKLDEMAFEYFRNNRSLVSLDISLNLQLNLFVVHLSHHHSLRNLNLRGIKNIPTAHLNRILDTNSLDQLLDPLGQWQYR